MRKTRKAEVYQCHAGLADIAVPVICEGQHIATLYSGQVLTSAPTRQDFVQIRQSTEHLSYIDFGELEKAYWKVPVVSEADIQNTVRILEIFAAYLATSWQRVREVARAQQREVRESQLDRKEFAHIVLEGGFADRETLRRLMRRIRFNRYPNRVMVAKLEKPGMDSGSPVMSFDVVFTAALHAIEELTDGMQNVVVAYLRDRGVCILLNDPAQRSAPTGSRVYALARKVLDVVRTRCSLQARIGIGDLKRKPG